jgi:hypothetical protein
MHPAPENPAESVPLQARIILIVTLQNGGSTSFSMAPGTERFVGRYARIPEFRRSGALLKIVKS